MINCRICNQDVEPDNYNKSAYKCKPCAAEYRKAHYQANKSWYKERHKEWYNNNKEKHNASARARYLKMTFNLTPSEYDRLMDARSRCAICDIVLTQQNAKLDHCHTTGKIRDVLCSNCNLALGLFFDSADNLKQAINYLEKHAANQ